jgi:hypothetical protein
MDAPEEGERERIGFRPSKKSEYSNRRCGDPRLSLPPWALFSASAMVNLSLR